MKKDEILEFLRNSPGWVLQYSHGIGGKGWWWLMDWDKKSDTKIVTKRSARAAIKHLKMLGPQRYGETNYGWRE